MINVRELIDRVVDGENLNEILELEESRVDTGNYRAFHGKNPRGHGSWFFSAHRGGVDFDNHKEGHDYIQVTSSYADAKKKAVAWGKEKGHIVIHVAS